MSDVVNSVDVQIQTLIDNARKAQAQVAHYSQEEIDEVITAIAWEVYEKENVSILAHKAVAETGMGRVEDKIAKHFNKVLGTLGDAIKGKSVGVIEKDAARGITKYAKPVGVVGALTPVTNPTATPASNAISVLKGRNAVIFAPHPSAKESTTLACQFMRNGLKKVGAPEDLIQVITNPSKELTNELMRSVDLVLATGGGAMVKAAYSSGKPAYGVGPGNSCQIVAEDADVKDVAKKLISSKSFDYATSCSSENSIVIHEDVYESLIAELINEGAHLCTPEEQEALRTTVWKPNKKGHIAINPAIIAKSATEIAKLANFSVGAETRVLMVKGAPEIEQDLFSEEKLSPVLTLYRYKSFKEGYEILKRLTDHNGRGHSCGIHTFNEEYIDYLGQNMNSSRIMVRQPQASANGGAPFNGMPVTTTLGCGTWGNNITTENINYKHFLNVTWLSVPIEAVAPSEEDLFGNYLRKRM